MAGESPKISVVIATYNCAATLARTLESLFSQVAVPQVLIADGGSVDGTLDIIQRYGNRIAWFASEPDKGVYDAWNKALKHASGDWIAFLGGDDWYPNQHSLLAAISCLEIVDARTVIVYGTVHVVGADGRVIRTDNNAHCDVRAVSRRCMPFTHVGALHRRKVFDEHGSFDSSLRIAGDYDLTLRVLRERDIARCPGYEVLMGDGGLSNSINARLRLIREMTVIRRKHALPWSLRVDGYLLAKLILYRTISIVN